MAWDTFKDFGIIDIAEEDDRLERRKRLLAEDAARRPWLIGKALNRFRYTWVSRVRLAFNAAIEAAAWSWRMSK